MQLNSCLNIIIKLTQDKKHNNDCLMEMQARHLHILSAGNRNGFNLFESNVLAFLRIKNPI